ncbi:MAG: hypothetical protein PWP34_2076 [Desulfuromonadales bacterium]|nr:hypothetical protein [Desulfuromonadales bacterium]
MTGQQAASDIGTYMSQHGGVLSGWYVGIAKDPRNRLFVDHNVTANPGSWIYRECASDVVARQVEDYFLRQGCKGGDGGGSAASRFVYAYKITSNTRQ